MTENREIRNNNQNFFNNYDFLNFSYNPIPNFKIGQELGGKNGIGFETNNEKYNKIMEEISNSPPLKTQKVLKGNPSNIKINEYTSHHFKFTTMIDFIEYLPGLKYTKESLNNAIQLSKNFIYISQYNFDSDVLLFKRGFKTNYSDWTAYTNHVTSNIYFNILFNYYKLGYIEDYIIFYTQAIENSKDPYIHPLNTSVNQGKYDEDLHPYKKENVTFNNIYRKLNILITIKGYKKLDEIYEKIDDEKSILYDSRNGIYEKKIEGVIEAESKENGSILGKMNNLFS